MKCIINLCSYNNKLNKTIGKLKLIIIFVFYKLVYFLYRTKSIRKSVFFFIILYLVINNLYFYYKNIRVYYNVLTH